MTDLTEAANAVRQEKINEIAGAHLGKAGDGSVVKPYVTPDAIDKSLLVPIPRELNRTDYGLTGDEFYGWDTWHAYEVSFLLDNGYPISCVAKINYDCSSECIVESKSLKLYMNSYNMANMGATTTDALQNVRDQISADLTEALDTEVDVYLHVATDDSPRTALPIEKYEFRLLDDETETLASEIKFDAYNESSSILKTREQEDWEDKDMWVWTPSLRSNCRVTNQPDWGDVYIYMKGDSLPTHDSLLQYIVSMRKENHFHEEICECIYKRLLDKFRPAELFVCCLYTRRGGIDINPCRYSHPHLGNIANGLRNTMAFSEKTVRQ